uniref:Uncharacterized protein n=1 Tax=Acrobeloides nanus TaxID=290746 RepID=A0A914E9H9_9BILA
MYEVDEEHSDHNDDFEQQQHQQVENASNEPQPILQESTSPEETIEQPPPPDPHPEGQIEPEAETRPAVPETKLVEHKSEPSKPTDDVYIQMHRSFRRTNRQAFEKSQENLDKPTKPHLNEQYLVGVKFAIVVQTMFHNFSMVLQGFLSGLSVGHAVFAFVFAEPPTEKCIIKNPFQKTFLQFFSISFQKIVFFLTSNSPKKDVLVRGYQWMAIPVQAAFYVCYTISAITALDRLETGTSIRETIQKFISLQRGSFGVIVWATGTVCSVLTTAYDEYLANSDMGILTENNSRVLIAWRSLSLARAICALIGWLLIALQPQANFTLEKLQRLMVFMFGLIVKNRA